MPKKLEESKIKSVKELLSMGVSHQGIARKVGVGYNTVLQVRYNHYDDELVDVPKDKPINIEYIEINDPKELIDMICKANGTTYAEINIRSRKGEIVALRQYCMYMLRKEYHISLNKIGSYFNNKDHSTVIHSIRAIENALRFSDRLVTHINNNFARYYSSHTETLYEFDEFRR